MQGLRLRPGISFGWVRGELVFLDAERDRYFSLRGDAARLFSTLCDDPAAELDPAARSLLLATGLMEESAVGSIPIAARSHIPLTSLYDLPGATGRPNVLAIFEIAARLVPIRRALAREGVAGRLRRIADMKASARHVDPRQDPIAFSRRFIAARPLVPIGTNCLSDSLALMEFIVSRGSTADLLLGVKLSPFAAHAWVQTSDLILNDHVDYVSEYSPVLLA